MNLSTKLPVVARLALGGAFLVFGLNGFLNFLPQPAPPEGPAGAFLGGLGAAGYMFPLIKGTEVLAGSLLLANRAVPIALLLLAPILVNIFAFHAFLAPGLGLPLALIALEFYLAYTFRGLWAPLFLGRSAPIAADLTARSATASAAAE